MPSSDESRIERRKQEVRNGEEGSKVTTYVALGGIAVVVVAVLFFLLGGGSTSSDGTDVSAFEGVKTVPNDDPTLVSRNFSSTGGSDGAVKVVYFGDFQCPHCKRFEENNLPKLVENYVSTGDVRFVFKPYPVVNENSFRAIHAAYEVWNQNRQAYWEWHRLVFENQRELARQNSLSAAASKLADYARQVGGVDASKVESAVTNQRYSEVIRRHRRAARKHGVRATPSFVVGNDSVVSGNRYAKLTSLIERETGSSNGTENSTASPPNSSG